MLQPGTRIGGLVIEALLGRGAMGEVYRATQVSLRRPVAVKRIAEHLLEDRSALDRFSREALCLARVHSEYVVGVHDFGRFTAEGGGDHWLLVMELIDGGTSLKSLAGSPLAWELATALIQHAALGLAAAAEHGVVHRDIKPDNLMLTRRGTAKLVDFGLARAVDSTAMTMEGTLMGTPSYMPPEACRGAAVDGRGDVYALGCTWFHLLAGRLPFVASNTMAMLRAHLDDPVPDIRTLTPSVPAPIAELLLRMMAKDPLARPPTAQALVDELRTISRMGLDIPAAVPGLVGTTAVSAGTVATGAASAAATAATVVAQPTAHVPAAPAAPVVTSPSLDEAATIPPQPLPQAARNRLPLVVGIASAVVIIGMLAVWLSLSARSTTTRPETATRTGPDADPNGHSIYDSLTLKPRAVTNAPDAPATSSHDDDLAKLDAMTVRKLPPAARIRALAESGEFALAVALADQTLAVDPSDRTIAEAGRAAIVASIRAQLAAGHADEAAVTLRGHRAQRAWSLSPALDALAIEIELAAITDLATRQPSEAEQRAETLRAAHRTDVAVARGLVSALPDTRTWPVVDAALQLAQTDPPADDAVARVLHAAALGQEPWSAEAAQVRAALLHHHPRGESLLRAALHDGDRDARANAFFGLEAAQRVDDGERIRFRAWCLSELTVTDGLLREAITWFTTQAATSGWTARLAAANPRLSGIRSLASPGSHVAEIGAMLRAALWDKAEPLLTTWLAPTTEAQLRWNSWEILGRPDPAVFHRSTLTAADPAGDSPAVDAALAWLAERRAAADEDAMGDGRRAVILWLMRSRTVRDDQQAAARLRERLPRLQALAGAN